jgi:glycerol kinase
MKEKYILTLDSGTTSCRSLIVDKKGSVVATSQVEFTQFFPESG